MHAMSVAIKNGSRQKYILLHFQIGSIMKHDVIGWCSCWACLWHLFDYQSNVLYEKRQT
jgi:hypothetical protein